MKTFISLLLTCLYSFAAIASKETRSEKLTGADIKIGTGFHVNSSRYFNPPPVNKTFMVESSYGLVKLAYPLPADGTARPEGKATVTVSLQYHVEELGSYVAKSTSATLQLDLGKTTAKDIAYIKLDGALDVTVNITDVSILAGWDKITLEGSIVTESFDFLEVNDINGISLVNDPALTADGNLKINWNPLQNADHYELEWTYVSDQKDDGVGRLLPNQIEIDPFLFRNNSSRVEVSGTSYEIPMIYEKGIILYRLRAVGKNVANGVAVVQKTEWTAPDGKYTDLGSFASANLFVFDGLEQNMNWQSSLNFAEEGKHKVALSYHDGSLKDRQEITRINSDKRSIVGEMLYDYNGRPVIQALPAPVTENTLTYFPNFNVVDGKTQLSKTDYDNGNEGNGCTVTAPPLSTSSGASQYYSPNNPFKTGGNTGDKLLNRDMIPDAEKYPYVQMKYTPDNTGRISAQSGVGLTHRLGSGKDIRYLYGAPQPSELSRLFGNQAGYALHYKKTSTIDPNGQASVTYTDMRGKLVASGLAGNNPPNLNTVGTGARTIKTTILDTDISNMLSTDRLTKTYSTKLVVTGPNTNYKFNYNTTVGAYGLNCVLNTSANPLNYSIDGVVDVDLQLKDNCGNIKFDISKSTLKGNTGADQTLTLPEQQTTLNTGEYQLTKTFHINEDKLEQYWQEYLAQEGRCIIKKDDFVQKELAKIDVSGCGITCEQCNAMVENVINTTAGLNDENKATLRSACDKLCLDNDITCRSSLEAMRGDLSPGGQYGQLRNEKLNSTGIPQVSVDKNNIPQVPNMDVTIVKADKSGLDIGSKADDKVDASKYPLSIFNDQSNNFRKAKFLDNVFGLGKISWRYPLQVSKAGYTGKNDHNQVLEQDNTDLTAGLTYTVAEYHDRDGKIFLVDVMKDPVTNKYSPAVIDETRLIEVNKDAGWYQIPVRFLSNLADFEKYWQPQWADYLLPYHPEYEYYLQCTANHASNAFDYKLMNTMTISDATKNGYVDASGKPLLIGNLGSTPDPYISSSTSNTFNMNYRASNFQTIGGTMRTMAQTATIAVGCPQMRANCGTTDCTSGKIDTDDEWNVYKAFYIAEKQKMLRKDALVKAVDGEYYNGCIGQKDYGNYVSSLEDSYFRRPITNVTPVTRTKEECIAGFGLSFSCNTITYTEFQNSTTYPYLNPAQLCYVNDAKMYEDKTARFYPKAGDKLGLTPAQNCYTYASDNSNPPNVYTINVPCDIDVKEAADNAQAEVQRSRLESCGQCPLAADIEMFLKDAANNKMLTPSGNLLVSCMQPGTKLTLGTFLQQQLLVSAPSTQDIFWSAVVSANGKQLDGQFTSGGASLATISLRIPDNVPVTFQTLGDLCCLAVIRSGVTQFFPYESGKVFNVHSSYLINGDDQEFMLEGKVSFAIDPCKLPPRCSVTDDADRTAVFLNILQANSTIKPKDLNTASKVVALTQPFNQEFYTNAVRILLKKDNRNAANEYITDIAPLSPTWQSVVVEDILQGTFSYTENGTSKTKVIMVSGLGADYVYNDITEFINVRPAKIDMQSNDACISNSCTKDNFKADAVIEKNGQRNIVTVTVTIPGTTAVACQPVIIGSK